MKKRIVLLGAGLVARPLVNYLLKKNDVHLTVVDLDIKRAEALTGSHPRSRALGTDRDSSNFPVLIAENDLVISLLPAPFHAAVARICLEKRKHLITASYVGNEMRALDQEAGKRDLLFLNEMGLDPGIDHMSAMQIIEKVRSKGGYISSFRSICGGFPAPEAADNPLKYKFSWSPLGVLTALKSPARYIMDGNMFDIPHEKLMSFKTDEIIEGYGPVEVYPNRDSIDYSDIYGIKKAGTVFRGTIRNPGWAQVIRKFKELNFLNTEEYPAEIDNYKDLSLYLLAEIGFSDLWHFCGSEHVFETFNWLGLNSDRKIPRDCRTPIEALTCMMAEKMKYRENERDMIILQHEFRAHYPDGSDKAYTSLMIDYGIRGSDSAMARTVSLPPAIAALLVLEGKIRIRGVQIPTHQEIFAPVLAELEALNIRFQEREQLLSK